MEVNRSNASNGWELQKENIRPLSSGRKVGLIKHSLETSMRNMADYETETDLQVKTLEDQCQSYNGDDPLEPWLNLINCLENSCLLVAKLKTKISTVLIECIKLFFNNPKYTNDKRFVDIYIKSANASDLEPCKKIKIMQVGMLRNLGVKCSILYLAIAELEESIGKPNDAVKTLRAGIQLNAQPLDQIKDALSQLEYRVAQRLAQTVFSEESKAASTVADARNFGSSVPVYGSFNEAPAFRTDLQSAIPVPQSRNASQSRQGIKAVEIFPTNVDEMPANRNQVNPLLEADAVKHNEENDPRPSKWNKKEVAFETESTRAYIETPRVRLQLYEDSSDQSAVKISSSSVVQNGVLKEWKEVATPVEGKSGLAVRGGIPSWYQPPVRDANASVDAQRLTESQGQVPPGLPLKMMCSRKFYGVGKNNEISFEHRSRDMWIKKEQEKSSTVEQLNRVTQELESVKNLLCTKDCQLNHIIQAHEQERVRMESHLQSKISECQNLGARVEQEKREKSQLKSELEKLVRVESHLQSKISECHNLAAQVEQEKREKSQLKSELEELYNDEVKRLSGLVSELTNSLSEMTLKNEELTALLSQRQESTSGPSSEECTFLPRSSNQTVRGGIMEESIAAEESMLENNPISIGMSEIEFLPPPSMAAKNKKTPFTLYESHVDSFSSFSRVPTIGNRSANRIAHSNNTADNHPNNLDFRQLSENVPPSSESNRNTGGQSPLTETVETRESGRANFVRPVPRQTVEITAPSSLCQIYTEDLDDTEIMEKEEQGGSSDNFNLTNLTHVLAFHPEPLLNSTPERVTAGQNIQYENLGNFGNYNPTQRIYSINVAKQIWGHRHPNSIIEGPASPEARENARLANESTRGRAEQANNLSPIQETSKENRSNCTTGSSSGNMTSTRGTTISGTSSYNSTQSTRSGGPRSISRYHNFN